MLRIENKWKICDHGLEGKPGEIIAVLDADCVKFVGPADKCGTLVYSEGVLVCQRCGVLIGQEMGYIEEEK